MVSVCWDETISDVCGFPTFVCQHVGVWFVVCDGAIIEWIRFRRCYECLCGWMAGEEGSESDLGFFEVLRFFGDVAALLFFGLIEQGFGNFDRTEKLKESQEVFSGSGREPVEGMTD